MIWCVPNVQKANFDREHDKFAGINARETNRLAEPSFLL